VKTQERTFSQNRQKIKDVGLRLFQSCRRRLKPTTVSYSFFSSIGSASRAFFVLLALGFACVLEVAVLLLRALVLTAGVARGSVVVTVVSVAGEGRAGASIDTTVAAVAASASLGPTMVEMGLLMLVVVGTSAGAVGMVGTDSEGTTWNSSTGTAMAGATAVASTGDSTIGDWAVVTSGMGIASVCVIVVAWVGAEMVSMDETPPEMKECEAPTCLDLAVYRRTATPTPVTRKMLSICSKTMLPLHHMIRNDSASFGAMSKVLHNDIKMRDIRPAPGLAGRARPGSGQDRRARRSVGLSVGKSSSARVG
jgi:hypothetical protein